MLQTLLQNMQADGRGLWDWMRSPGGCQQQTPLLYCLKTSDVAGLLLQGVDGCYTLTTGPQLHHGWGGGHHEDEVA